jgi:hypothetical protein
VAIRRNSYFPGRAFLATYFGRRFFPQTDFHGVRQTALAELAITASVLKTLATGHVAREEFAYPARMEWAWGPGDWEADAALRWTGAATTTPANVLLSSGVDEFGQTVGLKRLKLLTILNHGTTDMSVQVAADGPKIGDTYGQAFIVSPQGWQSLLSPRGGWEIIAGLCDKLIVTRASGTGDYEIIAAGVRA